jgi:hypothetical protein
MTRTFVLLVAAALSGAGVAQEGRQPAQQGLSPEQLRAVQFVGRSVLAARHAQTDDPEQAALRAQIHELRASLRALDQVEDAGRVRLLRPADQEPSSNAARDRRDQDLDDDSPKAKSLRSLKQNMGAQRQRLAQRAREMDDGSPRRQRSEAAIRKTRDLEDELEAALQAPREARRRRLAELRMRLDASPLAGAPALEAPAISTSARHRE